MEQRFCLLLFLPWCGGLLPIRGAISNPRISPIRFATTFAQILSPIAKVVGFSRYPDTAVVSHHGPRFEHLGILWLPCSCRYCTLVWGLTIPMFGYKVSPWLLDASKSLNELAALYLPKLSLQNLRSLRAAPHIDKEATPEAWEPYGGAFGKDEMHWKKRLKKQYVMIDMCKWHDADALHAWLGIFAFAEFSWLSHWSYIRTKRFYKWQVVTPVHIKIIQKNSKDRFQTYRFEGVHAYTTQGWLGACHVRERNAWPLALIR